MAAGLVALPHDSIYAFSVSFNTLCLCLALGLLVHGLRPRIGAARALFAGLLFAASASIWQAAWNGLETSLVLLLFTGVWSRIRLLESTAKESSNPPSHWPLCALLSLCVLTRADGFLMAGICVAYLAFKGHWRVAGWSALAVAGTTLANFGVRYAYYGYLLPNTYYTKVTGNVGDRLSYAWELAQRFTELPFYLAALAALLLIRTRAEGSLRKGIDFGAFFSAAWLAYWFYVGGDHFGIRFLLVVLLLGSIAIAELWPAHATRSPLQRLAMLLLALALSAAPLWRSGFTLEPTRYDRWVSLGRFLKKHHPGEVIATGAAGKIPYYSGLETIDMLGLNDLHIAHLPAKFAQPGHDKHDADYIYSRRPDLITGWIVDANFGLSAGLSAQAYRNAGYHLAYMVHEGPTAPWKAIVDVRDRGPATRHKLFKVGYVWAVLSRNKARDRE